MKLTAVALTLAAGYILPEAAVLISQRYPTGKTPTGQLFQCQKTSSSSGVVAVTETGKKTRPLIAWNSSSSPQRCAEVAEKLKAAVNRNGNQLSDLLLMTGEVRGSEAICHVSDELSGCNSINRLFDIPRGTNPHQAIRQLLNVPADVFVSGNPLDGIEHPTFLRFGDAVRRELAAAENSGATRSKQLAQSPAEIARQVTVRVLTNPGAGSGVIIERKGKTHTVLTCAHVANGNQEGRYTVLTPDGKTHSASRKPVPALNGVDLAVIEFDSPTLYRVAVSGNFQEVSVGEPVYTSGFPNYRDAGPNAVENTFDWGLRAFQLTAGTVSMILSDRSLPQGYQLGNTNTIDLGMSGGPALNQKGQLIGINGRVNYPFQGIDVFIFTDGTKPSPELFKHMDPLSWAVPISTFQQRIGQIPAAPQNSTRPTAPPAAGDDIPW